MDPKLLIGEAGRPASLSLRDVLVIGFRHWKLALISFIGVLLGAAILVLAIAPQYKSQMKFLVRRERVNALVTPDAGSATRTPIATIYEEDMNSEVEILKSRDLLERVVLANDLHKKNLEPSLMEILRGDTADKADVAEDSEVAKGRIASAVQHLESRLNAQTLPKTHLVSVTYESPDPDLSAQVLRSLSDLYMDRHVSVHRPGGTAEFFANEAERYQKELQAANGRLSEFNRVNDVVSASTEKTNALLKLAEYESLLHGAQAEISQTEKRVGMLEQQQAVIPPRQLGQVRVAESGVAQQLKGMLLTLQLKRTELLGNFTPEYRPVQEVETQIQQTRDALTSAEAQPFREETTDRDPTYQFIAGELAKNRSDLASLRARAEALKNIVASYHQSARTLDGRDTAQQASMLEVKSAQDNYMLYLRKEEEARIQDALDHQRILNVAVAEAPTVARFPTVSSRSTLAFGALLAIVVAITIMFVSDYLDASFRTPDEVFAYLNIPVVAAIPEYGRRGRIPGMSRTTPDGRPSREAPLSLT